ncbi:MULTISPECIES: flagellar basal-body rod protein FlgF [unclassified Caulobacter]|jgi:flagellar basal-body rod protein FlgF|uniref:flagellar basal-body rod protein FlgF n=1 Tax=unclassified Caulobacter TaxID=2648921 RepID=UPI000648559B|nr:MULTISPECIES: flagellar basal-body rod protein FlgF [unclassified Caulobacter]KQV58256.1 flagellar biosynthesis protein FlgF [Caulobacter sp. Root342]KQV69239.1 flagellar biosynthesis protein FlgF [Caulobacter sp. Root343]
MDNALYVGLSRQMTLRRELDIAANNIANANTTGFKVEDLMVHTEQARPAKTLDGSSPVKFVLDSGVARNFTQGALTKTGGDFDLAIEGQAFFKIQTASGERYTRDGRFTTNPEGILVTEAGNQLMDEGGGQITIDPKLGPVTIGKDGIVSQGAIRVGKIGLVRPDDMASLAKDGDNLYRNTANTTPQPVTDAQIHQGMLESSNVQPVIEITKLIEIQRAYEGVAKMMDNTAELSRSAVERLGKLN